MQISFQEGAIQEIAVIEKIVFPMVLLSTCDHSKPQIWL